MSATCSEMHRRHYSWMARERKGAGEPRENTKQTVKARRIEVVGERGLPVTRPPLFCVV